MTNRSEVARRGRRSRRGWLAAGAGVDTAIKAVTEPLIARHQELVGKDPPG